MCVSVVYRFFRSLGSLCSVFLALILLSNAVCFSAAPTAIEEFGSEKLEPIQSGFFFLNGKYIETPYIFERRGLDLYVNDKLISRGPEWPPYDYQVKQDPGDPPAGLSPLAPAPDGMDPRDFYWSKKWRYLLGTMKYEDARSTIIDLYRKSPFVKEVQFKVAEPDHVVLIDKDNRRMIMGLGDPKGELNIAPDKKKILAKTRENLETVAFFLRQGDMRIESPIGMSQLGGPVELSALKILVAPMKPELKLKELIAVGACAPYPTPLGLLAEQLQPNEQLTARVKALAGEADVRKAQKELDGEMKKGANEIRSQIEKNMATLGDTKPANETSKQASANSDNAGGKMSGTRLPGTPSQDGTFVFTIIIVGVLIAGSAAVFVRRMRSRST